ncbi:hypothetical protein KTT_02920 [Tengunoibacter tsumagoiensis]|uniref:Uncharacterized protein n=1 Tax=Tengunoibacter tsumagoiensis TaxID=2014871 RepID=A0A401ZUA3_9CHLR|nr:hypothetical protein KTT_02920 [Tengunoibacter tsumagoiensis]
MKVIPQPATSTLGLLRAENIHKTKRFNLPPRFTSRELYTKGVQRKQPVFQ